MKLEITSVKDTNAIRLVGHLDIYNVGDAPEALLKHLASKPGLELDLGGVESCDAAGIQLLLAARRSAGAAGKTFSIHTPTPAVQECSKLLGLSPDIWQPNTR